MRAPFPPIDHTHTRPSHVFSIASRSQRLENAFQTFRGGTPRPNPHLTAPKGAEQAQCEWLGESNALESLQMPDFPDFPAKFELPPMMPIPRLLPDPEHLMSLRPYVHSMPIASESMPAPAAGSAAMAYVSHGLVGAAVGLGAALVTILFKREASGRITMRSAAERRQIGHSKRAVAAVASAKYVHIYILTLYSHTHRHTCMYVSTCSVCNWHKAKSAYSLSRSPLDVFYSHAHEAMAPWRIRQWAASTRVRLGPNTCCFALRDPPGGICTPLLNTHALYSPMESIEPKQARLLRAGSALGERLDTCPGHRELRTRQYIYAATRIT